MPFVGLFERKPVFPGGISGSTIVTCPKCGKEMFVRGGPDTDCLRHFVHYSNEQRCSGESEVHHKWKQMVFRSLSNLYLPNQKSLFFCLEGELDVANTPSDQEIRRADILLRFGDSHDQFGKGIAIEIQHRNTKKNLHAVTYDYLSNRYSVLWVTRQTFIDATFDAEAAFAESDENRMFFRERSITLPEFNEFCLWDFDQLAELLDGTQTRLVSYTT